MVKISAKTNKKAEKQSAKAHNEKKKQVIGNIQKERSGLKKQAQTVKRENKAKSSKKDKGDFSYGPIVRTRSKTSIQTLPYVRMAEANILELPNGRYSKTYIFTDINYTAAREDEQLAIFSEYSKFLNSLAADIIVQVNISSKTIPMEYVYDSILNKTEFCGGSWSCTKSVEHVIII